MSKKNKEKYYAIKEGKGVKNLIVNNWEECSKLVLSYNSVYKSFNTRSEAEEYLNTVNALKIKEKAAKAMEAKKLKKATTHLLKVRISKEIYEKFLKKCDEMELTEEKAVEGMIKEWIF